MVNSFCEFCEELLKCGFSMGGGNAKGIYAVIPFDWKNSITNLQKNLFVTMCGRTQKTQ